VTVYDVECSVTFSRPLGDADRTALKEAVGGKKGWYGPLPVVAWPGPSAAAVYLVMRGSAEGPSPDEVICAEARAQVGAWLEQAGLAEEAGAVSCSAVAR
jgi:hypothetical protein